MHTLRTQDRDNQMDVPVSFHSVPLYRGTAFAIDHIEDHGGKVSIASGIRSDDIIAEHNRQFHTNLHGQQYAIDHAGQPGWSAANPINRTSHCGYADQVISTLLAQHGVHVPVGGKLPWWAWGIDLDDVGKVEDCSHFLEVAHHLGYHFAQPYTSGSERHHVIQVVSPIKNLERWNVISRERTTS